MRKERLASAQISVDRAGLQQRQLAVGCFEQAIGTDEAAEFAGFGWLHEQDELGARAVGAEDCRHDGGRVVGEVDVADDVL